MSTATTTQAPAATQTGNDDKPKPLAPLPEYLSQKEADGSRTEDAKAVIAAVEAIIRERDAFTDADKRAGDATRAGCAANLAIREYVLRGDNAAPDWYCDTDMYAKLWREYTGTGKAADRFRSKVATMISAENMVHAAIARYAAKHGLAGKSAAVKPDNVDKLISEGGEVPDALKKAIDKQLSTQVYSGNGASKGKRKQGAETPVAKFGKTPKAPKSTGSGASDGNASQTTPAAAWETILREIEGGKLSVVTEADWLHRLVSAFSVQLVGKPGDPQPEVKGRAEAVKVLAKLTAVADVTVAFVTDDNVKDKDRLVPVLWNEKDSVAGK